MLAIKALAVAEAMEPHIDEALHAKALGIINEAALHARKQVSFAVDGDQRAQDELSKRLINGGYKVDWITSNGPRAEDGGTILVSWGQK